MRLIEIAGNRYGRLIAVKRNADRTKYDCFCDCGKATSVVIANLKKGMTTSCGCFQRERLAARNTRHGKSNTSTYRIWKGMIRRCTKPAATGWESYGGRGISVCDRWMIFANFLLDMGERPFSNASIERLNNEKGYSPDNCEWANWIQQARNRRRRGTGAKAMKKRAICL